MTNSTDARDIAVDTLAATKAVIDHLNGVHKQLHAERDGAPGSYVARETVLARTIGECHDSIRHGLKFAEINALVAIADRLADLADIAGHQKTAHDAETVAQLVNDYNGRAQKAAGL